MTPCHSTSPSLPKVLPDPNEFPEDGCLKLPPRPHEISDDFEVEDLDRQFVDSLNQTDMPSSDSTQFLSTPPAAETCASAQLKRLHDNLESRLRPFWASPLSSNACACVPLRPFSKSWIRRILFPHNHNSLGKTLVPTLMLPASPATETSLEHELLVEARVLNPEHSHTPRAPPCAQGSSTALERCFTTCSLKIWDETVIPEMAEWYRSLWKRGVRFHYVSNSPFELVEVIRQFIKISGLPLGSVRLRSYTGKSLFNGILSAPATRKRANVVEVLDDFPQSKFILIGDSGEQDMELYAELAAERPDQIAGVFIRDVTTAGLQDPTGAQASDVLTNQPRSLKRRSIALAPAPPAPRRSFTIDELHSKFVPSQQPSRRSTFFPSSLPSSPKMVGVEIPRDSLDSLGPGSFSVGSSTSLASTSLRLPRRGTMPITDGEKKQWDLQNRVYRARLLIPKHIPFRVFEDPRECVEVEQITELLAELGSSPYMIPVQLHVCIRSSVVLYQTLLAHVRIFMDNPNRYSSGYST
ncbi:hypothetical protein EDC04DRAFT_2938373 [Pisolithus marmoratus]|nr:hypothetical protein EDC04DRAFT_2938373 [Pisolithus marmoratus]